MCVLRTATVEVNLAKMIDLLSSIRMHCAQKVLLAQMWKNKLIAQTTKI